MRQQSWGAIQPGPLPRGHGLTEVLGVPVDNDGGEQVETGCRVGPFNFLGSCRALEERHWYKVRNDR